MIINKLLIVRIAVLFYYFVYNQGCTIYYVQNDTSKLQTVRIIYNQNNDQTKKNESRLIAAEKAGRIVELHKHAEGLEKVFFDFRLPPKNKLPLNRLLSSTYFDTSSYASICYPAKNIYGTDTITCLRFDQLASNTKSDGIPFLLVRSEKKIFIK